MTGPQYQMIQCPSIPKFANESAAQWCELRNRDTSAASRNRHDRWRWRRSAGDYAEHDQECREDQKFDGRRRPLAIAAQGMAPQGNRMLPGPVDLESAVGTYAIGMIRNGVEDLRVPPPKGRTAATLPRSGSKDFESPLICPCQSIDYPAAEPPVKFSFENHTLDAELRDFRRSGELIAVEPRCSICCSIW